jgi:hypothetical protein
LHSLTRGRHPSHQGRRHRFSLSSSSVLNKLSFGCVFHLSLLLSPARVTRDSINSTYPNNPTFPVRAAPPNFLTSAVPPSLVHIYSLPLPAYLFPELLSSNSVDGQLSSRPPRLGHHQYDSR